MEEVLVPVQHIMQRHINIEEKGDSDPTLAALS